MNIVIFSLNPTIVTATFHRVIQLNFDVIDGMRSQILLLLYLQLNKLNWSMKRQSKPWQIRSNLHENHSKIAIIISKPRAITFFRAFFGPNWSWNSMYAWFPPVFAMIIGIFGRSQLFFEDSTLSSLCFMNGRSSFINASLTSQICYSDNHNHNE